MGINLLGDYLLPTNSSDSSSADYLRRLSVLYMGDGDGDVTCRMSMSHSYPPSLHSACGHAPISQELVLCLSLPTLPPPLSPP